MVLCDINNIEIFDQLHKAMIIRMRNRHKNTFLAQTTIQLEVQTLLSIILLQVFCLK
jgi:hypothetical protein